MLSRLAAPPETKAASWLLPNVPELLEDMCAMSGGLVRRARVMQTAPSALR